MPSKKTIFKKYFEVYGGWKSLSQSKYLLYAFLLNIILYQSWIQDNWWDTTLGILPTIIGFTLGGFAILLAFGDSGFIARIAGSDKENKHSSFLIVSSTFVHFIYVQTIALVFSLISKSLFSKESWLFHYLCSIDRSIWTLLLIVKYLFFALSFTFFCYSITMVIAATFAIFRMVGWLDFYHELENKKKCEEKNSDSVKGEELDIK